MFFIIWWNVTWFVIYHKLCFIQVQPNSNDIEQFIMTEHAQLLISSFVCRIWKTILELETFYSQQNNCTPHEDWRNLLKSENSSTFTIMFTSPRIPCIVSNTGIQPDITDPAKRNQCKTFFFVKPKRCTNFTNLFGHETLHVSDSSSVHHQEFIHCTLSNGICHTGL